MPSGAALPPQAKQSRTPVARKGKQQFPRASLALSTEVGHVHYTQCNRGPVHAALSRNDSSLRAYTITTVEKTKMMPSRCTIGEDGPWRGQKQKSSHLCNFFSIRDSLSSLQSKNEPEFRWLPAVLHLGLRSKRLTTIPNRKNLAIQTDFLFLDPKTASHQHSGQDRVVAIPQAGQGGRDSTGGMGRS